jgi:hypothetical protein
MASGAMIIHTKFHKDRFRDSGVDREGYTDNGDLVSVLSFLALLSLFSKNKSISPK